MQAALELASQAALALVSQVLVELVLAVVSLGRALALAAEQSHRQHLTVCVLQPSVMV